MKTLADAISNIGEEKVKAVITQAVIETARKMSPKELKDVFGFKGLMSKTERKVALS